MLTKTQAQEIMLKMLPEVSLKSWTVYGSLYLFRVQYPMSEEADFDPFFSVDVNTGEALEFSITTDGNPVELAVLKWKDI